MGRADGKGNGYLQGTPRLLHLAGCSVGILGESAIAEGDRVQEGEVIVEIEMAKSVQEVTAPVTGVLRGIVLSAGATAAVYAEIAEIDELPA
jgi:pyruvate/2-oxoglutarate dehydrogenase complex dihydrolipoamide acyltransferase (E2) component